MKRILAIDPGASGGFAWEDVDGIIRTEPMPDGMAEQIDKIVEIHIHSSTYKRPFSVVMEKTGTARPTDAKPSAVKFARHCGTLEGACYALGLPVEQVAPGVWQRSLGQFSKDKSERKREIRDLMARKYPHLKVTLKTADALGLLTYAMK